MTVTELIRDQTVQCAVMAAAGVAVMIMYQVFRCICDLLNISVIISYAAELLFWVSAAMVTSQFLYYCAYGRLSFHSAAAFVTGALLWKKFFCGIIDKIYARICIKQGMCKKHGEKETKQPIQRHQSGD